MLEICATVWDGQDYLPEVLPAWFQDPAARFIGLERDGRLAAFGRLARFAPGEYWLEAIRVHADFRRRGLAAAWVEHALQAWRASGEPGTLRLVTHSQNGTMLRLFSRLGFTRLLEITFTTAAARPGPHTFALQREAAGLWDLVRAAPLFAAQHGLCDLGWRWKALTPEYLAECVAAGEAWAWRDGRGLLLMAGRVEDGDDPETLFVKFLAFPPAEHGPFLAELRALAAGLGKQRLHWSLPADADWLPAAEAAGFPRTWDDTEVCFELRR